MAVSGLHDPSQLGSNVMNSSPSNPPRHAMLDERRTLLRHYIAALVYRTHKTLRGAPESFGDFAAQAGVRTPSELLRHMTGVLGYARTFFVGGVFRPESCGGLAAELRQFDGVAADLARILSKETPLKEITFEQLLQGPLADAMTHAGQLAMLRRMAGIPIESENFIFAAISKTVRRGRAQV